MNDGNKPGAYEPTVTVSHVQSRTADITGGMHGPAASALPIRDRGRYEFLAEHARGGLGRVWRATESSVGWWRSRRSSPPTPARGPGSSGKPW